MEALVHKSRPCFSNISDDITNLVTNVDWKIDTTFPMKLYGVQLINTSPNFYEYEAITLNKIRKEEEYTLEIVPFTCTGFSYTDTIFVQIPELKFISDTCIRFSLGYYWDPNIYDFRLFN